MKENRWIPVDKRLVSFLPKDRPFTKLEAMFSLTFDYDTGNTATIQGYSSLWKWSRGKVERFLNEVGASIEYPESTGNKQNQRGQIVIQIAGRSRTDNEQIKIIDSKWLKPDTDTSQADNEQIAGRSQGATKDPNPKTKPKPISSEALRLSNILAEKILSNNQKHKPIADTTLNKWAGDIEMLNRLDGQSWADIEAVLLWSQQDSFWKSNILSGSKFRDKWDTLTARMQQTKPHIQTKPEQSPAAFIHGTPEYQARLNDICMRSL